MSPSCLSPVHCDFTVFSNIRKIPIWKIRIEIKITFVGIWYVNCGHPKFSINKKASIGKRQTFWLQLNNNRPILQVGYMLIEKNMILVQVIRYLDNPKFFYDFICIFDWYPLSYNFQNCLMKTKKFSYKSEFMWIMVILSCIPFLVWWHFL